MDAKLAVKTVRSIQAEYREIVKELVTPVELKEYSHLNQIERRVFVASRLLDGNLENSVSKNPITDFEKRLNTVAHRVFDFWKAHASNLAAALSDIDGFKLASAVAALNVGEFEANVRRLGIYFDTLIVICPIHEGEERLGTRYSGKAKDIEEVKNKMHIAVNLLNVALTESLDTLSVDRPIVVIAPDFYASLENCRNIDVQSGFRLLDHLLGKGFNDVIKTDPRGALQCVARKHRGDPIFRKVFDEMLESEYGEHLPLELRNYALRDAPPEVRCAQFMFNAAEAGTDFNIVNVCSARVGADPIVTSHKRHIFRSYLEANADEARKRFDLAKEESMIANVLLSERLKLLEALSLEDLKILRCEGSLERTREFIRSERARFRRADYEDPQRMSEVFAANLITSITEAGNEHTAQNKELSASIRKNAIYFAGACVVGAASIALPQTLLLNALGVGYSAIIGGSALEIANAVKEKRTEIERFKSNPLGLLYTAFQKAPLG